jgi:hypothetical protein
MITVASSTRPNLCKLALHRERELTAPGLYQPMGPGRAIDQLASSSRDHSASASGWSIEGGSEPPDVTYVGYLEFILSTGR